MRTPIWLAVLVLACDPARATKPPPVVEGRQSPPSPATRAAEPVAAPVTGDSLELFVFDWPAVDRSDLERIRSEGAPIYLRVSGGVGELHPECRDDESAIDYRYTGESPRSEHVERDGKQLDVTIVGTWKVARMPSGACDGATHVVHAIAVGAFEASSHSSRQTRVEGSSGGATVGGSTSSTTSTSSISGALAACAAARAGSPSPPQQCGAAIRLSLAPIRR